MHRKPFTRLGFATVHHGTKRGGDTATHACGGGIVHRFGQADEVEIRAGDGDALGKRTPLAEADYLLMVADRRLSAAAIGAGAAAEDERGGDPVAHGEGVTFRSGFKDIAGEFVAHHMRQNHVRIGPFPRVMVRAADAAGVHGNDRAVAGADGIGDVCDVGGRVVAGKEGCAHRAPLAGVWRSLGRGAGRSKARAIGAAARRRQPPSLQAQATMRSTTSPKEEGVGTMVTPASDRISTFSCADSPKAETMAPAWPMRRPLGAERPAI